MFNEEKIKSIKEKYKSGMRIELINMNDSHATPKGTKGVVDNVDSVGTIHVNLENGSKLGLIIDVDEFKIISKEPIEFENRGMGKCIILKENSIGSYSLILL